MTLSLLTSHAGASLVAAVALSSSALAQTIWHVNASAPPGGDGLSWATAMNSLNSAMSVATPVDRIWVAAGKYFPENLFDPTDPRSARFLLASDLKLFGGFDGTETILSERDPTLFDDTILSGDLGVPGDPSDNAYQIVQTESFPVFDFAHINGFRITGGNSIAQGGGISIRTFGPGFTPNVKLINCTLNDNQAVTGGAIAVEDLCRVEILRCVVEGNTATLQGGAVHSVSGGVRAANSRFTGNTAGEKGGALYARASNTTDTIRYANCLFIGNKAIDGGAVYLHDDPTFAGGGAWHNCTFVQNQAVNQGSAFYAPPATTLKIYNSILWGNSAPTGPSIFGIGQDVRYSDIEGGYAGVGNLNVDPQFTGVARPQSGAPVNDAGSNSLIVSDFLDVDGDGDKSEALPLDILDSQRRANDPMAPNTGEGTSPIVDMGAYERKTQGTTPP